MLGEYVRSMTLEDVPEWLTNDHAAKCIEDSEIQNNWEPKEGDWYFCKDLYIIKMIDQGYRSQGDSGTSLSSDSPIGPAAHGGCDFYIPMPEKYSGQKREDKKSSKNYKN